jgi:hypothetical protein
MMKKVAIRTFFSGEKFWPDDFHDYKKIEETGFFACLLGYFVLLSERIMSTQAYS